MQIARVNYGYGSKKYPTQSFKGRIEQRQFMEIVNAGLKEAAGKCFEGQTREPVINHFEAVFEKLAKFFKEKGFKVEFGKLSESREFSFFKSVEGIEDERISINFWGKNGQLRYNEEQLLEGNPGRNIGQTMRGSNIIYECDGSLRASEIPKPDDNKLVSRIQRDIKQDFDRYDANNNHKHTTSVASHYKEYLITDPQSKYYGDFGYRTDFIAEKL